MEKLERIYNKVMKTMGLASLKETEKLVKTNYSKFMKSIPEDQLFKVSPKFTIDPTSTIEDNINGLIERNICEHVAKINNFINKNYKFDFGNKEGECYRIYLISPDEYTKTVESEVTFEGDTFKIVYCIPEVTEEA